MKKATKLSALMIALFMICLCLGGCDELDDMREKQAFWTTKGSIESITLDGEEYKRLPGYDNPDPLYNVPDSGLAVNVTDPDVPVLLSDSFAEYMNLSADKNFITGSLYNIPVEWYDGYLPGSDVIYCKTDIYDEVAEKINAGIEYTKYGFGCFEYDEEKMSDKRMYYYLTDEENDAINTIIEKVKPLTNNEIANNIYELSFDKISEDKYFGKASYELYSNGINTYYLAQYSNALDIYTCYEVPQEYNSIFKKFEDNFRKYSML